MHITGHYNNNIFHTICTTGKDEKVIDLFIFNYLLPLKREKIIIYTLRQ